MASIIFVAQMATLATTAILMLICLLATTRDRGKNRQPMNRADQARPTSSSRPVHN